MLGFLTGILGSGGSGGGEDSSLSLGVINALDADGGLSVESTTTTTHTENGNSTSDVVSQDIDVGLDLSAVLGTGVEVQDQGLLSGLLG